MIGIALRQARTRAGLTQEELAFRATMDRSYISMVERGIKSPTLTTFFRLCDALEVRPEAVIAECRKC